MIKGFWNKLRRPIVGVSPMDGVTDAPWRFVAKKYGNPDVVYTEFVSAEGLWRIRKRNDLEDKIWKDLKYGESERPVVVQLFGSDPASFYESAKIVCELGFDGIDINMGCPSPGLERRGGGAGLMRVPNLARQVIEETRRGVRDWSETNGKVEIPVSVKTRIGSSNPDPEWWKFLSLMDLPAVAMHGRTFKQLYGGVANWEVLEAASKVIRNENTLFLANGDVGRIFKEQANGKYVAVLDDEKTIDFENFADGVLVGRKAMGNPWAFRKDGYAPSIREKLEVAIEHSKIYEEMFGKDKFFPVRKHLVWYAHGFDNASELRKELVLCNDAKEVEKKIRGFLKKQK